MKNFALSLFLLIFSTSLLFSTSQVSDSNTSAVVQEPATYYVLAVEGLDLLTSGFASSEVIQRIPYGSKVKLVKHATTINLKIDRIESGLAEVTFNGVSGFLFEGYLSKFPAPKEVKDARKYIELVRSNKISIYYEEQRKDWSEKKYEQDFTTKLPTEDWIEAFLVSQQLFDIPERVFVPKQMSEPNDLKEYKNDLENLAKEILRLQYDSKGNLETLTYELEGIGDKQKVILTKLKEEKAFKLEQVRKKGF